MKAIFADKIRGRMPAMAGLSAGLLAAASASGVNLYTSETDEPEPRAPQFVVSYGYPDLKEGSSAAQMAETLGFKDEDMGGLEDFFWQNDPYADWHWVISGSFLVNPEDASLHLKLTKSEKLTLQVDYYRWMEYDNGAGIYYPARDSFFVLSADALEEEINKLQVSLQLMPSDGLTLTLDYSLLTRDGESLSTRFGDDYQYLVTGIKSRGVVPALNEGKETVHRGELSLVKQDGVDRSGVRVHAQRREVDKSRTTERAASQPSRNRYSVQEETSKDDLFGFSAFTRKQLSESIYGSIGLAYNRLDGDVGGSRLFTTDPYDPQWTALQLDDRGFENLENSRRLKQTIVNANLVYEPEGNFRWMGGLRYEYLSSDVFSSYLDTFEVVDYGDLQRQTQQADMLLNNRKDSDAFSGFLEVRYKGIAKALLYSRVEADWQDGNLLESWNRQEISPNPSGAENLLDRLTSYERQGWYWEAGANYYPTSNLRISVEGYLKYQENGYGFEHLVVDYNGYGADNYPGWIESQEIRTQDVNARVHWRILPSLKSISRVDLQTSTTDSKARETTAIRGSERERVVFNQALTWTPHPRIFVNASYMLSDDLVETPAAGLEGTFEGIVVNLPNDYWQADLNLYCVLTKKIDLQLGYHYLEMTNHLDTSPKTVPYGTDIKQHQGSADVILHLSERLVTRLGYRYYEQTDPSAAGLRDYEVHVFSGSAQYKF
jgi:opacity protein-like surface antigen